MNEAVDTDLELLGARLKTARLMSGKSMRALAAAVDISVSHVSAIESGRSHASVSIISRLCQALDMTIADLFAESAPQLDPVRAADREVLRADARIVKKALIKEKGSAFDVYEVDLKPGGATGGANRHPGCTEVIYTIAGHVTVRLDQSTAVLDPGDSITFPSEVEHEFSNRSDEDARLHWTVIRQKGGRR
ncbi:XRE family transcriptional regulator [Brevibacterium sp. 50QC2O2]|uniref:helix-turn-helix domain-containing protein n=1 Tax=Brevibacterium TaxID=1696 RepID=UPI00211C1752|nr:MULTISPECIES: XRE family transcriptional regulator [unclassified Brevibacterium]MCQ9385706.1 XRE family transcriptional regulator [Brevibacterium sp. 68QC2CO]MCQ9388157.1 XRE family transcriptional regulator [Brevibacterium sp. 50QC2O2]